MSDFIAKVVSSIVNSERKAEDQIIVLPSKRAGVFFKNELKAQIKQNTWSPEILTIEDLILEISSLNIISSIQLLFEYYKIYLNDKSSTKKDSFDKFTKWATISLYDFNEIDRYMIDPQSVFKNLQDLKRLEIWNPEQGSELMNKFMRFWHNLEEHYYKLNESLAQQKLAYQGMAFKMAAQNIENYISEKLNNNRHFHFVGFNAINKAEEIIITSLLNNGRAEIYWDSDSYYIDNPIQEAGMFQRKHRKAWNYFKNNKFNWVEDNFDKDKEITIIGVPKSVGQAKVAGKILEDLNLQSNNDLTKSALVLADENLLLPVLNSLPESINKVNITMGYPIKNSPLAGLFELIFNLHEKVLRLNRSISDKPYYTKDLIKLLKHPAIKNSLAADKINTELIIDEIIEKNMVFAGIGDFKKYLKSDILKVILGDWNDDSALALKNSLKIIKILKSQYIKNYQNHSLDLEYLFRFSQVFNQLEMLQNKYSYLEDLRTLLSFYKQLLSSETLAFRGEPLLGLQLMGMLETRVLGFDNVILTSVNEGILPSGNSDNSFIPYDLKMELGLPTYKEKDAIYSYHFYRLIQRSKKVFLLYNTETDEFGSGEKSRFITQLLNESKARIKEYVFSAKPDIKLEKPVSVYKNKAVLEKLDELAVKGFSPSSLANYMRNPLDFYYQKVLNLKEAEEIEETVDFRTLGIIVHEVLEELYKPYIDKLLSIDSIELMRKKVSQQSEISFRKNYNNGDFQHGKNHLIYRMVQEIVKNFLNHEQALIEDGKSVKIIALEKRLETKIHLKEINKEVLIKGFIDRIDMVDNTLRILDYKTGNVTTTDLSVKSFENIIEDKGKPKALQLLIYALMFRNSEEFSQYANNSLIAGIMPLKKSKDHLLEIKDGQKIKYLDNDILGEVEDLLSKLLLEIYSPEINFEEKET